MSETTSSSTCAIEPSEKGRTDLTMVRTLLTAHADHQCAVFFAALRAASTPVG